MIDALQLDLREPFRLIQASFWLLSSLYTIYLSGGRQWSCSRPGLKITVAGWASSAFGMFLLTINLRAEQLFPWGFAWWCALAPIITSVSSTFLVRFCHSVMNELNKTNNRRTSCLITPSRQMRKDQDVSPLLR
jgi:hypothetical protein